MSFRLALLSLLIVLFSSPVFAQDKAISFIKNAKLKVCPNMTVGQMFSSTINKPVWESGVSKAGEPLVEVTGTIGKGKDLMSFYVQFEINPENGTFKTNGMKINGQLMERDDIADLYKTMCQ